MERRQLLGVLQGAQDLGLIGPGELQAHLDHTAAWAEALGAPVAQFLDLGTGGGVPGLPLALLWPEARATLLDSRARSITWVGESAARLGIDARVVGICERAEVAARDPELRESFPLVLARGFGAPAVTAECGSPFVALGGRLSVSEPPGGDATRWPAEPLATLGLRLVETRIIGEASFVMLEKVEPSAERWPRRTGKPHSRPLW
ncbi:MAG: RsmG family class I SAM-dependent methyltransferase [Acidimicrobiia bacterium]